MSIDEIGKYGPVAAGIRDGGTELSYMKQALRNQTNIAPFAPQPASLTPVERSLAQRITDLEMRATSMEEAINKAMDELFGRLNALERLVRG